MVQLLTSGIFKILLFSLVANHQRPACLYNTIMTDTELFKKKFNQWREYLGKGNKVDANSISGLLLTLYWEMGAYEAYVAICKNNPSSPLATLLFGNLTAFNYIQIQALRIRRLCEPYANKGGKKDVSIYSLRRLVDEMKQERKDKRFTKANVCKAFEIPVSKDEVNKQTAYTLDRPTDERVCFKAAKWLLIVRPGTDQMKCKGFRIIVFGQTNIFSYQKNQIFKQLIVAFW